MEWKGIRKRRKVNGWIRWKADIISGCESFITERRNSWAERGEVGIFDVVASRYEYRKVPKGIPWGEGGKIAGERGGGERERERERREGEGNPVFLFALVRAAESLRNRRETR